MRISEMDARRITLITRIDPGNTLMSRVRGQECGEGLWAKEADVVVLDAREADVVVVDATEVLEEFKSLSTSSIAQSQGLLSLVTSLHSPSPSRTA